MLGGALDRARCDQIPVPAQPFWRGGGDVDAVLGTWSRPPKAAFIGASWLSEPQDIRGIALSVQYTAEVDLVDPSACDVLLHDSYALLVVALVQR